jgi:hypothetical protein
MISGIKRKTTAIESAFRFFQTTDLIINHFKRDADRQKIFELISPETTLQDLLVATSAVHLYHNLGIRVKDTIEVNQISFESAKINETSEKKTLMEEISSLLKDSLFLEINLLNRLIKTENQIISLLIEERKISLTDTQRKERLLDIENQIEQNLMEIILKFPPFYFYDLIGDLIGFSNNIKLSILEESSAFKDLSMEIEKKLSMEEKEDKFIELSTLNRLINMIQSEFEFKSYKELQMQNMSLRMIKRKVLEYNFNRFPISIPGLNMFLQSNQLKLSLMEKIRNALENKIVYDAFENEILDFLKKEIIKQMKSNPNDLIYYLESLNDCDFKEIVYIINKLGIPNILDLINTNEDLAQKVSRSMIRYNIDEFNIIDLNSPNRNLILLAKKTLCDPELVPLYTKVENAKTISDFNLLNYINSNDEKIKQSWHVFEKKSGIKLTELKDFIKKKEIIDKVFLQDLKLKNYSQILLLLKFDEIINNLAKNFFYYIFSKILRQISRIIESYLKVTNDKALILLALKKIYGTTESEEWVRIKLEELIINRVKKRQKELVIVFNANNQPFLVNGFILARLIDLPLNKGVSDLRDEISPIYEDVKPLKLNEELISPISYCIAYDLIKRFEKFEVQRKTNVEEILVKKEEKAQAQKREVREKQQFSTLNWIERRIISSLMRISSPGINPNQFYWQEKDTKTATDNIKLHSELGGKNVIALFTEYFQFAIEKIRLNYQINLPSNDEILKQVNDIIEKELGKRLGHLPKKEEIEKILEGERLQVAKQIAVRIGKFLDKALYEKFKNKK